MNNTLSSANVVVLRGIVTSSPVHRRLPDGSVVVQFDLTTALDGEPAAGNGAPRTVSVPIAWHEPRRSELTILDVDLPLVVVGTVRRRFFRSGGMTQSRTEVVVDRAIPARRRKTVVSAVAAATAAVTRAVES